MAIYRSEAGEEYGQTQYMVWLAMSNGTPIRPLPNFQSIQFSKKINGIGWGKIVYGVSDLTISEITKDKQIHIWRKPIDGQSRLEFIFFIREWTLDYKDGEYSIVLQGPDQNDLLRRRMVLTFAGTTNAIAVNEPADDLMKRIVRNEMAELAIDPLRDITAWGFSVAHDTSSGPNITRRFAWKNVLKVLEEINESTYENDNEVFFNIVIIGAQNNVPELKFRTWINQPGIDRTSLVFSPDWGTMDNAQIHSDYMRQVTYVLAGGQGEGSNRILAVAYDELASLSSPFGRIEEFKDARNEDDTGTSLVADEALAEGRARLFFSGDIKDVYGFRYGVDWNFGDKVSGQIKRQVFEGIVRQLVLSIAPDGRETVKATIDANVELT